MKKKEKKKSASTTAKPRRDFLTKGASVLAGLALTGGILSSDASGQRIGTSSAAALNETLILLPDGKLYNQAALYEKLGLEGGGLAKGCDKSCNKGGCTFCLIRCGEFEVGIALPLVKGTLLTGGGMMESVTECKKVIVALKSSDAQALVTKGVLSKAALEQIRKLQ